MPKSNKDGGYAGPAVFNDPAGSPRRSAGGSKDLPLEALRGFAAIIVLLWHSMLGFFPQWSGVFADQWPQQDALNGQVWFGLIYGPASVTLFFVLSSFVLTRRFFVTGNQQIIVRGVIKRWPRLAGPVLITVLISWILIKCDAYRFKEAGSISQSPWLQNYALALNLPSEGRLWEALKQGIFLTFFRGDSSYDSNLWTMKFEFVGSFIAFALALFISVCRSTQFFLHIFVIAVTTLVCYFSAPAYAAFPAGVALALLLPQRRELIPIWASGALVLVSVYLFGFAGPSIGAFGLAGWVFRWGSPTIAHISASIMIIAAIELAPEFFRRSLSGRIAQFLGALSFPLYLIHVLIICSLGCSAFIWAGRWTDGSYPAIIACGSAIIGSIAAAIPLMYFNNLWVLLLNRATNYVLLPPAFAHDTKIKHTAVAIETPASR